MLTKRFIVKIIENKLLIILATTTRVIKHMTIMKTLIITYLVKLRIIIDKNMAALIRNNRTKLIVLITQAQSRMKLAEITNIMKKQY